MNMVRAQPRLTIEGVVFVAMVVAAYALVVNRSHGSGEHNERSETSTPHAGSFTETEAMAPAAPTAPPAPPTRLGTVVVAEVREYFAELGSRFEERPLQGGAARVIGTYPDGQTVLELVGSPALEQATLRYKLRSGELNGRDMAAIMYLMERVKADEAQVRWAIDAARKGAPTARTLGAVAYAVQAGPGGMSEFVMRPSPGNE